MFLYSILEGFKSIRISPLQTFFSILGIIIGVASLVAILALGDGLEEFARKQVSSTTSLQGMSVSTRSRVMQNGVYVRVPDAPVLTLSHKKEIQELLDETSEIQFNFNHGMMLARFNDSTQIAGIVSGLESATESWIGNLELRRGSIDAEHFQANDKIWINDFLLNEIKNIQADTTSFPLFGKRFSIAGILKGGEQPRIIIPFSSIPDSLFKIDPPNIVIKASSIEQVNTLKTKIERWKLASFGAKSAYITIETNEFRLKQAEQGLLIFRVVMGLITGISVLVGGIGVMNVLLMSVKERTPEIGIRKAIGAKRSHVVIQFLAESVSISTIGSLCGLLFAALFLEISVPIIKSVSEIDFPIAWTLQTIGIISGLAVFIGIFFGTFPAWKAARLHPIEAIQRV
jgi:putative ABC transport system permease protein